MLGDVLTSTIIADQLKLIYPASHIDYLVVSHASALVEHHPHIDGIIKVDSSSFEKWTGIISLSRKLKPNNYHLIIDSYGKNNSAFLTSLLRSKTRIGYNKWFSKIAYTVALENHPDTTIYTTGIALGSRLLLTAPLTDQVKWDLKPRIYLTDTEKQEGLAWLQNTGLNMSRPVTMISVLGSSPEKTYPAAYMASLLNQHVKSTNAQVLFNYIPSQKEEALAIYNLCHAETQSQILIDAFAPSIRDFLKVLHHCTSIIGNEGGAINMGKALGVPSFTIFSPWVKKQVWNAGEDGENHISVHLEDFEPKHFGALLHKKMKSQSLALYQQLKPEYFLDQLAYFEKLHYQ
jgi:heptosyltransferase-2